MPVRRGFLTPDCLYFCWTWRIDTSWANMLDAVIRTAGVVLVEAFHHSFQ